MFDLFRSREKSVRILLGALLMVVALSMLTYLVPQYNTGAPTPDTVVASVGRDEITSGDVARLIQATMRGRQLPPELISTYIPQMVDEMVNERSLAYEATKLGFEVSDDDVRAVIQQMIPNLFPDGKFAGKDAYAAVLAEQQLTIPEFEANLRRQILINKLREVAVEGTIVSSLEIEHSYRERFEKIKIQYVKVTGDKYRAETAPTAKEMETFFQVNQAGYKVPESRNLAILIADQAKIAESFVPTDAELLRMYNQNKEQFRTKERVHAQHILLKTAGKPPAEDAKMRAQAADLLKQIKGGANFAEMAKKYSEDTGSAVKGGDLDWIERGQTLPEFERTAFSLGPGETSGIVKTEVGYHIIHVIAHEDAHLSPFEQARAQLAAGWKNDRVNDLVQQISDKAQAVLQKDPLHPDEVAARFHMQVIRADGARPGQPLPEIGTNNDFDQSIAGLKQGQVSQPVALPGNKLALAVVTGVTPSRPNTLAEVEDQVRAKIVESRLAAAVQAHAKELADKAKANGGDLEAAAKSMGLEVKISQEFNRSGAVEGVGPASYVQKGFSLPDGAVFGPVGTPSGSIVAKVIAHAPVDMSQLPQMRNALRDEIKSQRARDRNTLFETGVREELRRQGKLKYHQDVINRLVAQYRAS
ncbi:MAG: peptidylprolyl isomerase [Bryobacteraceae bacterium]|jgi:peptidyl-prolyl cis-trans isomerase D